MTAQMNEAKDNDVIKTLHQCAGLIRDAQRQMSSEMDRAHINDTLRMALMLIQRLIARVYVPNEPALLTECSRLAAELAELRALLAKLGESGGNA